ncbi:type II secretion system protein GspL [Roseovarius salis]|uniref:type II secretion system protein GspL n=1 Tax=Roseovarius salis TaxID=3376063 RepID=UPI0037C7F292
MTSAARTARSPLSGPLPALAGRVRRQGRAQLPVWPVEGAEPPPKGRFVATVPGADVPLVTVDLPPGLRGPARETVARRQLVDRLGLDLSEVELRPAPLAGEGALWSAMLMLRRDDLAAWRQRLVPHGKAVQAILPDYLALPASPDVWTVQTRQGAAPSVQVRLGPADGFSTEPGLAGLALGRALEDEARETPKAVLRLGPALPELDAALDEALQARPDIVRAESPEALPRDVTRPQAFAHGELALDLARPLQDPRRDLEARLRGAVLPVVLLLLAAGIWAGAGVIEIRELREQVRSVQERNIALVRDAFLPTGPLPDVRMQVSRLIEERRAALAAPETEPDRPLRRAKQVSAVLAEPGGARLEQLVMQPDGRIRLELQLPDFGALETLVGRLRAAGLAVDRGRSASAETGAVVSTLTILPEQPDEPGPGGAEGDRP